MFYGLIYKSSSWDIIHLDWSDPLNTLKGAKCSLKIFFGGVVVSVFPSGWHALHPAADCLGSSPGATANSSFLLILNLRGSRCVCSGEYFPEAQVHTCITFLPASCSLTFVEGTREWACPFCLSVKQKKLDLGLQVFLN